MLNLKDKVALITGSTTGIGLAIAKKLAQLGANIVINYLDDNSLELANEVTKEIESFGVKVIAVKGDVSDFEQSKDIIEKTKEEFGRIDILVNNAGITRDKLIMRMSEQDFDSVINVNLKGAFNMIKHSTRLMLKQKSGSIINISSVVGRIGNLGQANYAASKAGLLGLTKSVAREFAAKGVRANAICPGFIETKMTHVLDEEVVNALKSKIPLNSLGSADDVANLVAFLASDESKYITGQSISVDGGMSMQ